MFMKTYNIREKKTIIVLKLCNFIHVILLGTFFEFCLIVAIILR